MPDPVGNPKDQFPCVAAHMLTCTTVDLIVKQISSRKMLSFFCMIKVTDYQIQGAYNVICMKLLEIHVMYI